MSNNFFIIFGCLKNHIPIFCSIYKLSITIFTVVYILNSIYVYCTFIYIVKHIYTCKFTLENKHLFLRACRYHFPGTFILGHEMYQFIVIQLVTFDCFYDMLYDGHESYNFETALDLEFI